MIRIAMIGGGPKCLFALLELNDVLSDNEAQTVQVDVYDPYPPGAGRVWNTTQPKELRLNVNSRIIDASSSLCDQTFNEFRNNALQGTTDEVFPPRALVGEYLSKQFQRLVQHGKLPVTHRASAVHKVERQAGQWLVTSDSWYDLYDEVVIATGHGLAGYQHEQKSATTITAAELTVERSADAQQKVPDRSTVRIRGAALTAYDVVMTLTEGRGGQWAPSEDGTPGRLRYVPSGKEPRHMTMFSRHCIPMTPKPMGLPTQAQDILHNYRLQLRQWSNTSEHHTEQMWRILLACAMDIAGNARVPASKESLKQTVDNGRSEQFSSLASPFEQMRYSLDAHHGLKPQTHEWVWAIVWSGLYSELVAGLARYQWYPEDRKKFNAAATELERMAFGPPEPTAQKLLALYDAGMLQHQASVMEHADDLLTIDAVTPPPGVLTKSFPDGEPANELISSILSAGEVKIRPGERGLLTDTDGTCINADGSRNETLSALGRPTEDPTLGHDTLNRTLHLEYRGWAQRIMAQVNARGQKVAN